MGIIWKSRGGRVVNGVPREVPRQKPEGPQAPRVLAAGLPCLLSRWQFPSIWLTVSFCLADSSLLPCSVPLTVPFCPIDNSLLSDWQFPFVLSTVPFCPIDSSLQSYSLPFTVPFLFDSWSTAPWQLTYSTLTVDLWHLDNFILALEEPVMQMTALLQLWGLLGEQQAQPPVGSILLPASTPLPSCSHPIEYRHPEEVKIHILYWPLIGPEITWSVPGLSLVLSPHPIEYRHPEEVKIHILY